MSSTLVESQPSQQERDQQERQRRDRQELSRSSLVRRLLNSGSDLPAFMEDLLTTQAIVVAGTEAAGFIVERGAAPALPDGESDDAEGADGGAAGANLRVVKHIRPDRSADDVRKQAIEAFKEFVGPCVERGVDGLIRVGEEGEPEPQYCLITLMRNEGEVVAASAVITRCQDDSRAQQRLDMMGLVAGYFDLFMLRRSSETSRTVAQSHQDVLQLASAVSTADGFQPAAANLCNELSTRLSAARVSVGWLKGRRIKLQALSHTEEFDKKQELSLAIVRAMEECLDQGEVVQFDPAGEHGTNNVTRDAAALSRAEGGTRVVSLPLRRKDEIVGILTLEFPSHKPATPQETTALAVAADLLAPQLYDRYQNDRFLVTKAGLSVRDGSKKVFGLRTYTLAKVIAVSVGALLLFVCLYSPVYQVKAPFEFKPVLQAQVSSPFDGVIQTIYAKLGDTVKEGDALVELDTRDLVLKRNSAESQRNQAEQKAQVYRADDKIAESAIALSEAEEAQAQIDLLNSQIERSVVRAPIDGQVIRGDLEGKARSTVKQGEPLFEVAPKQNLRAVLYVNERDVQRVRAEGTGVLATESQPGEKHPFTVDRVIPAAEPRNGQNVFPVYATVTDPSPAWRAGLEGEARVDWERKPLIWQWTHRLVEWVRLKLWV